MGDGCLARLVRHTDAALAPFTIILLLLFAMVALPFLSAGYVEGTRAFVQRAADAAALAGADAQVTSKGVDARGYVYCETVAVDPVNGPAAASQYWATDTAAQPNLTTQTFLAAAAGNSLTVTATVRAPVDGLVFANVSSLTWSVLAEAEAKNSSGLPTC